MKVINNKLKNVFLSSLILCGAGGGLGATEIYNQDDKKIDLYGNIRGYVMDSVTTNGTNSTNIISNQWHAGLQNNSRLGSKFTFGNFFGHIELGLKEQGYPDNTSSFGVRLMYGQYDMGDVGKVTFGRLDTPMAVGGFVNDVLNTDNGGFGFGALGTANRKFQVQYYIYGVTLALIESESNQFNASGKDIPRFAATYEYKDDSHQARVGFTYKYYYATADGQGKNRAHSAAHILLLDKYSFGKGYVSGILAAGINGTLYGEQTIKVFNGNYSYGNGIQATDGGDVVIASGYGEAGYSITDEILVRVSLGYQMASIVKHQKQHNFMIMANAPIKATKNVIITPQIGYYGALSTTQGHQGGLALVIRTEFTF